MDSVTLFDAIPYKDVAISMLQSATLFILALVGLQLVGRRVFGEKAPQDLVVLILISEACSGGLFLQEAGYWGAIGSTITLLILAYLCDRIECLRNLIERDIIVLYQNNELNSQNMIKNMVNEHDLQEAAREYGLASYKDFSKIILEADGNITGILQKKLSGQKMK